MILSRFTNRLNIKDKLREIKSLVRDTKDKRRVKRYKQKTKTNKGISYS